MLTNSDIQDLIRLPKTITSKLPVMGYREENGQRRCDLDLQSISSKGLRFEIFVRQSEKFIENFSIGLRYLTGDKLLGSITLVRYNGPHGEKSRHPDGHFAKPHIHRITAAEIALGSAHPQERHREFTDRYGTFQQALSIFFDDIATANHYDYFPDLSQWSLF